MAIENHKNYTLTGEQVKDLASRLSASVADIENKAEKALTGATDPTSSTEGEVGQLYINTTSGDVFILKEIIEESGAPDTYTWEVVGSGTTIFDVDNHTLSEAELQALKDAWDSREPIFIHYGAVGGQIVHPTTGNTLDWTQPQIFSAIMQLGNAGDKDNPRLQGGQVDFTPSTMNLNFSWNSFSSLSMEGDSSLSTAANGNAWVKKSAIQNYIGNLSSLTTDDKTSLVNAINEVAGNAGGIKTLTTADYNYNFRTHTTTNPNCVALWLLENGIYSVPVSGVVVSKWYSGQSETDSGLWLVAQGTDAEQTAVVRLTHLSPNCVYDGTSGEYPIGPESVLVYKADGQYYRNQYSGESFLSWDQSKASQYSTSWASPKLGDIANLYDTLSQTYTSATAYVAGKAGLVPNSPVGTEYTLTSSGWKMAQSDYDQNDDTKKDYIKNRPFYETTTTETQSLIDGTAPSYAGAYDNGNTDPLCADVRSDLQTRGITNSGFFYDAITPATLTNIVNALQAEQTIHFENIGGYAMGMEEEVRISATFVNNNTYTQLAGGVYAVNGTLNVNGTNYPSAVMYIGQSSQLDSDVQYSENYFSNMYPNGCFAIICANNVQYQFPESMMMIDSGWVWTIATEVEVSVLKQLDSKFIKVDGDTISVNSDGELEAQVGGGGIKTLTAADYPSGVELWTLASGYYVIAAGTRYKVKSADTSVTTSVNIPVVISNPGSGYTAIEISRNIRPEIFTVMTANGTDASDDSFVLALNDTRVIRAGDVKDVLTSTSGKNPLSANQGKVLKDLIDSIAIRGAGAPTTSTVGTVGQLYEDGTNGDLYQLKSIDITVTPNTYNWEQVGGSSVNVVQTTGTSTTDVMSQNAITSMVFADPATKNKIRIGGGVSTGDASVAIGYGSIASKDLALSLGALSAATQIASVAFPGSAVSKKGEVAFGLSNEQGLYTKGYNDSRYRLLTGLYDGQSAHDAATKGQLDTAIINGGTAAPTTSTAGAVGTQYTYVDTTSTPTAHLCVCTEIDNTDPSNPVYTWSTLI